MLRDPLSRSHGKDRRHATCSCQWLAKRACRSQLRWDSVSTEGVSWDSRWLWSLDHPASPSTAVFSRCFRFAFCLLVLLTVLACEVSPTLASWQDWRPNPSLHACSWHGELMFVRIVSSTFGYVKLAEGLSKREIQDGLTLLATAT